MIHWNSSCVQRQHALNNENRRLQKAKVDNEETIRSLKKTISNHLEEIDDLNKRLIEKEAIFNYRVMELEEQLAALEEEESDEIEVVFVPEEEETQEEKEAKA